MAQKVKFKRKTTEEIDDLEIEDGSLIYNIENGKTYMDYGNQRIPTGGGGSNGGIYVGEEEPTDPDVTLWVDTPISETKASEIVDEYTESDKVGYSTNYVNELNTYSTDDEVRVGTWINGKPIYRKVIDIPISTFGTGTATAGGSFNYEHNISNFDICTKLVITWRDSNSQRFIPSNYFSTLSWASQSRITSNGTRINIELGTDVINRIRTEGQYMYAILEYTKTTD